METLETASLGGLMSRLIIKTDPEGQLISSRIILATDRGRTMGYTIQPVHGGGCVFTGNTTSGRAGGFDLLLVKIDKID